MGKQNTCCYPKGKRMIEILVYGAGDNGKTLAERVETLYSSEVKKIHTQIVEFARAKYNDNAKKKMDVKDNLRLIRDELGEYITKIIGRVPMLMLMYVYINREAIQNIPVETNDEIIWMTLEEQGGYKE